MFTGFARRVLFVGIVTCAAAVGGAVGLSRATADPVALRRLRRRLWGAGGAPWLHREVARRMAERLPVIKRQPTVIVDWWAGPGGGAEALGVAYPSARRIAVRPDELPPLAQSPAPLRWSPLRWRRGAQSGAVEQTLVESQLDADAGELLWANMMLHLVADPRATMRQWLRALAVDGFLMFSTLGPGSFALLRELYRAQRWPAPHAPFVDMHDLGDMLIGVGFADPVMDQETLTLTWPDADALLGELRTIGANVDGERFRGLRTPRWRSMLAAALARRAGADGRIALDVEIVYGHAFRPLPRAPIAEIAKVPVRFVR